MSARDSARVAHQRFAVPDAFRRHLGNDAVVHLVSLRERERERRDQIATRCPAWRTR
jgi:hypothetical protein